MAEKKQSLAGRAAEASTLSVAVLLVAALLGMVNYLGWKYHKRFDWTASEIYSLSDKSTQILAALDRDVEIMIFMQPNDELYPPVKELLARYEAASPRITVREVDPSRNLAQAQELVDRYQIDALNVILFESEGERRLVETKDLADYDYSGMQFGQAPRMTGFNGEQSFTSALLELTETERPKVVFTTGHGETQLNDFASTGLSGARELLERDNFEVESWSSLGQASVPAGVRLVVIAGPTSNFIEPELDVLASFLEDGGRLMVMIDPTLSPGGGLVETGLESFLGRYGVTVGEDIVVDPANPLPFFGADTIFVNSYGSHSITRPLEQAELPTILPLARSVGLADGIEGYETAKLLETSAEGWGETDLSNLGAVQRDAEDLAGPVSLAVAVEAQPGETPDSPADGGEEVEKDEDRGLRMVVVGDATFATNAQLRNIGNLTLLSNALNWLAEREALVAIPAKTPESVRLSLTSGEMRGIFWFVVLGLPALVVAAGLYVGRRRRS
jgi:ABC-type uncharacterized transport system involved in gliding motility auxiliary subunit